MFCCPKYGNSAHEHWRLGDPQFEANDPETRDPKTSDPETRDPKTSDPKSRDPKISDPKEAEVQEAEVQEARVQEAGVQEAGVQEAGIQESMEHESKKKKLRWKCAQILELVRARRHGECADSCGSNRPSIAWSSCSLDVQISKYNY